MTAKVIHIYGDSILKGMFWDESSAHYLMSEPELLTKPAADLSANIVNRCRFGCTIAKGFRTLQRELPQATPRPQYVIIEYGGNDCDFDWVEVAASPKQPHRPKLTPAEFEQTYRELIAYLKAEDISPVLTSLAPISSPRFLTWICRQNQIEATQVLLFLHDVEAISRHQEQYSLIASRLAQENDCALLDLRSAFLRQGETELEHLLGPDGIHPSLAGHSLIRRELLAFLPKLFALELGFKN